MTDIDPKSDIELHAVDEHVIVQVPLAGPVTGEWLRRYQRLARGRGYRPAHHRSRGGVARRLTAPRIFSASGSVSGCTRSSPLPSCT